MVDQGSGFYNKCFKKCLKENNIEIYSTHNEEKSVISERFIKTFKDEIDNHMTTNSKNLCFDVLNDTVDESNNTYHRTIKMKPMSKVILLLNIMKNLMKKILNLN